MKGKLKMDIPVSLTSGGTKNAGQVNVANGPSTHRYDRELSSIETVSRNDRTF